MRYNRYTCTTMICLATAAFAGYAFGISPTELRKRMDRGDRLTVIDIRTPFEYQDGHIPAAINIPVSMISNKRLPPEGDIVVCGGGLGRESAGAVAVVLREKTGLDVEVLAGGYAAWLEVGGVTTGVAGLRKPRVHYVTYEDLKSRAPHDMVLVDLRASGKASGRSAPVLSNLAEAFPGVPIVRDVFEKRSSRNGREATVDSSLYVLIDSGDGLASETARTLYGNNVRRVLVLLGGEEMIARGGRAGLQRLGPGKGDGLDEEPGNAEGGEE